MVYVAFLVVLLPIYHSPMCKVHNQCQKFWRRKMYGCFYFFGKSGNDGEIETYVRISITRPREAIAARESVDVSA